MANVKLCSNCRTITTCMELGCGQGSAPSPSTAPTVEVDERAALLAVLKPFADAYARQAEHDDPCESEKMRAALDRNTITPTVTVGDFRRAHAAYLAALASRPAAQEAPPCGS